MANTDGGVIFLGVEDPEKSSTNGIDRIRGIEENIRMYLLSNKYIGNKEVRDVLAEPDTVKVSRLFTKWATQGILTKMTSRPAAKKNIRYRLPDADEKDLFAADSGK